MKVWTVVNQKGGVGKTTTAISLASWLSVRGYQTLLIDLDPHGSLSSYFGVDPDQNEHSVYQRFQSHNYKASDLVRSSGFANLDFIPAATVLATLDRQLGAQDGKGLVIKRMIDELTASYSYVLIDCAPILGVLMVNALAAADKLVIPVQTEYLALKGLERMMHTVKMIEHGLNHHLACHVVATMYDRRTRASRSALAVLKEQYRSHLLKTVVPVDTLFRDASRQGIPLPSWQPQSRGAHCYGEVLDELLGIELDQLETMLI